MILYAIPTPLGGTPEASLPRPALEQIRRLKDFVVENAKSARAFLSAAGCNPRELSLAELSEHTPGADVPRLLQPLRADSSGPGADAAVQEVASSSAAAARAARVRIKGQRRIRSAVRR